MALSSISVMADTLVLRTGRQIEGTYLGGDSRKVRMAVGEAIHEAIGVVVGLARLGCHVPAALHDDHVVFGDEAHRPVGVGGREAIEKRLAAGKAAPEVLKLG